VIGDSVNLASRIEGITKQYQVPLIISEDTCKALSEAIPCVVVDLVRLKGKQHPIKLFTPAELLMQENEIDLAVQEFIDLTDQAFHAYQNGYWEKAGEIYGRLGQVGLFDIMSKRCEFFKGNDPGDSWDGVFTYTIK
jgi:adenylate cyclase